MTKEVIIDLELPAHEITMLIFLLSQILVSTPIPSNPENTLLTYILGDSMTDEDIRAKIEPVIGTHVKEVTITKKQNTT
ncbi:hypothetical protein KA089_00405 [Candidatus Woesebacteria bacterium]|nr:hypothetical protein [Candidatus Woesebacteria bacterium]